MHPNEHPLFLHTSAPTTTDTRKEIQNHSLKHRIVIYLQPFQKVKQSYWNWIDYLKPTSPYSFHFNQIYHHLHILPLMQLSAIISVRATRVLSASRLIPSEWPHAWTYNKWHKKSVGLPSQGNRRKTQSIFINNHLWDKHVLRLKIRESSHRTQKLLQRK